MDLNLLRAAAGVYFLVTVVAIFDALAPRRGLTSVAVRLLWAGCACHLAALVSRSVAAGYLPITSSSESLAVLGFVIVVSFLALQTRRPVGTLAVVIGPLAFVLTFASYAFYRGVRELPPNLKSALLPVHVSLAIVSYALFSLAFAVSLAYLLQERRLKAKRIDRRFVLPPLETLDRLNHRFLTWGLSLFTLGIVSGIVWAHLAWGGRFWLSEPRLISAGCTWAVYALVFQGRVTAGLRGRRAANLTIFGFATMLFWLLGGSVFIPGRHGGTFG